MKFYLLIVTVGFFFFGRLAYAESIPVEHPEEVFSLDQMLEKYNCNESQNKPQCAAISFFLCEDSFVYEKCDSIGVSGERYKAILSEVLSKQTPLERAFYAFPGTKIITSKEKDLPEWMLPKAALIWGYSIYPQKQTDENWDKLIHQGPTSIPLYAFGYGMLFLWKNERWELWKIEDPTIDGCLPVNSPICLEHTWNYKEEQDIMQLFYGKK